MERDDPAGVGAVVGTLVGAATGLFATGALVYAREEFVSEMTAELASVGVDTGLSTSMLFWVSVSTVLLFRVGVGLVVGSLLGVLYGWLDDPGPVALAGLCLLVGVLDGLTTSLPVPNALTVGVVLGSWLVFVPGFVRLYDPDSSPTGPTRNQSHKGRPDTTDGRKVGVVLAALGLAGLAASVPYVVAVSEDPTLLTALSHVLLNGTFVLAAIIVGLRLAPKMGFDARRPREALSGDDMPAGELAAPAAIGVGLGVVLLTLDAAFLAVGDVATPDVERVTDWRRWLLALYGGLTEEIVFRFGLVTALAWAGARLRRQERPSAPVIWVSIVLAALAFAVAHLPLAAVEGVFSLDAARLLVLNGLAGVIFGWLYWNKGLFAAMAAHLGTDLVLHVAVPVALSL